MHRIYANIRRYPELIALTAVVVLVSVLVCCVHPATPGGVFASYATDLSGRTPHQRFNARRAAAAIDGVVVKPGATFSFDDILHGWTHDQGFLKAPVSYDGTLIDDYGGGVCETSTTLYNTALLAGLTIVERHAHSFSPGYAPPGRDAAVAYPSADLRFKNPYPWPLTIHIAPIGDRLVCQIQALHAPKYHILVRETILGKSTSTTVIARPGGGLHRSRWHLTGRDGLRVAVYRSIYAKGALVQTEEISDNTYLPISRAAWAE